MEIPFALVYVAVHEGLKRAVRGAAPDETAGLQSTNDINTPRLKGRHGQKFGPNGIGGPPFAPVKSDVPTNRGGTKQAGSLRRLAAAMANEFGYSARAARYRN